MTAKPPAIDDPAIEAFIDAILQKKALDVVALNVADLTSVADAFIICSARSHRQVTAIAEHVLSTLKKKRIFAKNVEGKREGHWVLMDYGDVIVHIFYEPLRQFYDLESLWIDAERIALPGSLNRKTAEIPNREDREDE